MKQVEEGESRPRDGGGFAKRSRASKRDRSKKKRQIGRMRGVLIIDIDSNSSFYSY